MEYAKALEMVSSFEGRNGGGAEDADRFSLAAASSGHQCERSWTLGDHKFLGELSWGSLGSSAVEASSERREGKESLSSTDLPPSPRLFLSSTSPSSKH